MKNSTWQQPLFYLTLALMAFAMCTPLLADIPLGGSATSEFSTVASSVQSFAGVLLVIGVVIGGLLWMANKPQIAIGVLVGTAVVFGGPYILTLIGTSLGASGS